MTTRGGSRLESWRGPVRLSLAAAYVAAGILHFVFPQALVSITPAWVPEPEAVVYLTGIAEIAGAVALAQPFSPALRRIGGIGLAAYALAVFPANINHMLIDMALDQPKLGWAYHAPRMVLQPILIWLALWTSRDGKGEGR